jgi:hypothetical protein
MILGLPARVQVWRQEANRGALLGLIRIGGACRGFSLAFLVDSNAWRYNLVAFDWFSLNIPVITFTMQPVPGFDTPQTAQFIAGDVDGTHIDQYGAAAAAANEAMLQPDAAGTSQQAQ